MDKFNYLGVMRSTDGDMREEVAHRVLEEESLGTMASCRIIRKNYDTKRGIC